ncbi:hypothetical protein [Flavobacterium geliluteum]|uniref:Uncharacterized protein n=1 Tax=Flavobacterium geliluteum TaxID=2816120 RepID=A0A941B2I2_9FLAO|nr:hypothetical protein [Flavobacterium geliluteum]MBP4137503.1 hypothetical protein [Flavobacterium geliluteum]
MKKSFLLAAFLLLISAPLFSQTIADLKLKPKEIPKSYALSDGHNCVSIQACSFYNDVATYNTLVGTVKKKEIQSFKSKGDSGTIMYFEFENRFKGDAFLQGLLWGRDKEPTDAHPEEYLAKGKFLIIWSFHQDSPIKEKSEEKIEALLQ